MLRLRLYGQACRGVRADYLCEGDGPRKLRSHDGAHEGSGTVRHRLHGRLVEGPWLQEDHIQIGQRARAAEAAGQGLGESHGRG
eukprot:6884510-Pyramimonas_sp.AAC.1